MRKVSLVFAVLAFAFLGSAEPKIGFLYSGPIGDFGWTYQHEQARLALPYGSVAVENVTAGDVESIAERLIQQGCNILFCTSWEQLEPIQEMAKRHPNIKFFVARIEGEPSENVWLYLGRMYQARYLAGIVAGAMTKSDVIGYVAAFPIPEVIRGINAFARGIALVNPDAIVKVIWTVSWYDPPAEQEAAYALIAAGADVLCQHVQGPTVQQVAEKAGVFAIGYNSDMREFAPHMNLTSCIWDWTPLYKQLIQEALGGACGRIVWVGLESGVPDLAPIHPQVPLWVRKLVEHEREHDAPVFPELDDAELMSMDWYERNVVAGQGN